MLVQHHIFQSALASGLVWAPTMLFRGIFICHAYLRRLSHHPQNPHSSWEAGVPKALILPPPACFSFLLWMGAVGKGLESHSPEFKSQLSPSLTGQQWAGSCLFLSLSFPTCQMGRRGHHLRPTVRTQKITWVEYLAWGMSHTPFTEALRLHLHSAQEALHASPPDHLPHVVP